MAAILCCTYIFYLTSLMLSHYLVKHKSIKFYRFSGKLGKNSVRALSYLYQFNNFWLIHDKIAETLCLVLKVCPAPRTRQVLRRRRHWPKCPHSSIRRISSSLTFCYSGSVNFLLHKAYTPDAVVVWVQIRVFVDHSVGETKSVTFLSLEIVGVA